MPGRYPSGRPPCATARERSGYRRCMDQEERRYRLVHEDGRKPAYFTGNRDDAGRWALAESEKSGFKDWQLEVDDGGWRPVEFPSDADPGPT
jgi:hypothetical protein